MFTSIVAVPFVILFIYLWKKCSQVALTRLGLSKRSPLPPGPPRTPLVGNLFDIPRSEQWHRFLEWKEQYGDIVYVEALGSKMLIINTLETMSDLFGSRHAVYCDRPKFIMAGELMGLNNSLLLMRYGEEWRRHRRLTHMALSPDAVKKYDSIGDIAARYVASLVDNPRDFERHLRVALGRIIMAVTYGIPVDTPEDLMKFTTHGTLSQFLIHAERTMRMIVSATVPGSFIVDLIPGLKYLPAWIPFNQIQATAARERAAILNFITHPYEYVKRERQQGTNRPSFTSDCLDKFQSEDSDPAVQADVEHTILWAAGTLYGGGVETTYSATLNFILALALYPDVQAKLNEEFTRVVGTERLPTLQDRDALPYLWATIKETLRWRPAAPLSIARATRTADVYKGYYIPEGTIVVPNLWAMSRDDKSGFPPEEFIPERHLADKVKDIATDPHTYVFGFGRRICPGIHLADNVLFMLFAHIVATVHVSKKKDADGNDIPLNPSCTFAHIVATVHVSKKKDADGNDIPLTPSSTDGLVICPNSFEVDIKPHSQKSVSIIKEKVSRFA